MLTFLLAVENKLIYSQSSNVLVVKMGYRVKF